jgi:hypothetical protein
MSPEATIALIGIIGTLLGSFGGTVLANRASANREARQWTRQIQEQRRRELLEACEHYIAITASVLDDPAKADDAAWWHALVRVQLLAPADIVEHALNLDEAATNSKPVVLDSRSSEEDRRKILDPVVDAHEKFIEVVRLKLRA